MSVKRASGYIITDSDKDYVILTAAQASAIVRFCRGKREDDDHYARGDVECEWHTVGDHLIWIGSNMVCLSRRDVTTLESTLRADGVLK